MRVVSHSDMHDSRLDDLAEALILRAGVAPAATLGFAARSEHGWRVRVGAAGRTPTGAVRLQTVFDLASLTKPFVAACFARLCEEKLLCKATALGETVEEACETSAGSASFEQLLSHRAGLPAHRPLFEPLIRRAPFQRGRALSTAASAGSSNPPAEAPELPPPLYSDLGYLLAGAGMERSTRLPLDRLVRDHVSAPLGLSAGSARQWLASDLGFLERVAPTESVPYRGGILRGVVHDDNAWAFSGHALSGHAGLFGTAEDILKFGMALLDALRGTDQSWLPTAAAESLVHERPGGTLRMGFDAKSGPESSAGASASARTFGHLGFTGTSFWCDPAADLVTVLLTNRVCPTRTNLRIRAARPRVHEELYQIARP